MLDFDECYRRHVTGDPEAANEMFTHLRSIAINMLKKDHYRQDFEDMLQYSLEFAWKSFLRYDPKKSSPLTFMMRSITNGSMNYIKHVCRFKEIINTQADSLDAFVSDDSDRTKHELIPATSDDVTERFMFSTLKPMFTKKEWNCLVGRYYGFNPRNDFGWTPGQACNAHNRVKVKLSRLIGA